MILQEGGGKLALIVGFITAGSGKAVSAPCHLTQQQSGPELEQMCSWLPPLDGPLATEP